LEGVYVELLAVSPNEADKLPRHAVEKAVTNIWPFPLPPYGSRRSSPGSLW
jgi:hypothetical protein